MRRRGALTAVGVRRTIPTLADAFYDSLPNNPLLEIGHGGYYLTQKLKRFDRTITLAPDSTQTLDYTVLQRWLWQRDRLERCRRHGPLQVTDAGVTHTIPVGSGHNGSYDG